jgi:hypothetical protein
MLFKREPGFDDCPICASQGFAPIRRPDAAILVDAIYDVLVPMLRRNPSIADTLADAHPRLIDAFLEQRRL